MDIQLSTPLTPPSTCESDSGKIQKGQEVFCPFTYPYNHHTCIHLQTLLFPSIDPLLHHTRNQSKIRTESTPTHPWNIFFSSLKYQLASVFIFWLLTVGSTAVTLPPFDGEKHHIQTLWIYLSNVNKIKQQIWNICSRLLAHEQDAWSLWLGLSKRKR